MRYKNEMRWIENESNGMSLGGKKFELLKKIECENDWLNRVE